MFTHGKNNGMYWFSVQPNKSSTKDIVMTDRSFYFIIVYWEMMENVQTTKAKMKILKWAVSFPLCSFIVVVITEEW